MIVLWLGVSRHYQLHNNGQKQCAGKLKNCRIRREKWRKQKLSDAKKISKSKKYHVLHEGRGGKYYLQFDDHSVTTRFNDLLDFADAKLSSGGAISEIWGAVPSMAVLTGNLVSKKLSWNASPTELLRCVQKFSTKLISVGPSIACESWIMGMITATFAASFFCKSTSCARLLSKCSPNHALSYIVFTSSPLSLSHCHRRGWQSLQSS